MRVLFLDVDGVLNRTGYQPERTEGMRDWIEPDLAARLCEVVRATGAAIVLSSDWRLETELAELRAELAAAGIAGELLHDATPELEREPRWREIEAWMTAHGIAPEAVAIVDDLHDMGPLAHRFVRTTPLSGLDEAAAAALIALLRA